MRLNKEDFNKLDELIRKIGFGSYYDLIECLKMILDNMHLNVLKDKPILNGKIKEEIDLHVLINLILELQRRDVKE